MKKLQERECTRCGGSGETRWGACWNCGGTGRSIVVKIDHTKTISKLILTHKGEHPIAKKANWERIREIARRTLTDWETKGYAYDKAKSISQSKSEEKMVLVFKRPKEAA